MRKLTKSDYSKIQKNKPARYYVLSIEDGTVRVTFDSDLFVTAKGEPDSLGNIWEKDWDKVEAKVFINGQPKLFSFGGVDWSFIDTFIAVCNQNEVDPEDLPGHIFDITMPEDWTYNISYIGKDDGTTTKGSSKPIVNVKEDVIRDLKEVIENLKKNSPAIIEGGLPTSEFLKICSIKGQVNASQAEAALPKLEEEKVILISDDKVHIL